MVVNTVRLWPWSASSVLIRALLLFLLVEFSACFWLQSSFGIPNVQAFRFNSAASPVKKASSENQWSILQSNRKEKEAAIKYGELVQVTYDSFVCNVTKEDMTPQFVWTTRNQTVVWPVKAGLQIFQHFADKLLEALAPFQGTYDAKTHRSAFSSYKVVTGIKPENLSNPLRISPEGSAFLYGTSNFNPQMKAIGKFINPGFTKLGEQTWFGYCAYDAKSRDLAVVYRGTLRNREWVADNAKEAWLLKRDDGARIHRGFWALYNTPPDPSQEINSFLASKKSLRNQTHEVISSVLKDPSTPVDTITFCGHSLGSALATVAAFDCKDCGVIPSHLHTRVYSYAGPLVGDSRFKELFEDDFNIDCLRFVNRNDIVPGRLYNGAHFGLCERIGLFPSHHVGTLFEFDDCEFRSPHGVKRQDYVGLLTQQTFGHNLLQLFNPSAWGKYFYDFFHGKLGRLHNMEMYLYAIATDGGKDPLARDPRLMEKSDDLLQDKITPQWFEEKQKQLVWEWLIRRGFLVEAEDS